MPFLIRVPALVARRLYLLTLFYLALPLAIFFVGWLRPLWGIPSALLLLGTLGVLTERGWKLARDEGATTVEEWRAFRAALLWTWVPVAFMVLQIGAGGFGLPTEDWENKHNLIFADLVKFPWPVIYHGEGAPSSGLMLVYYLGYYLPAAAVGKVLGWSAANVAWQLWTQLGFLLVCCWMVAFVGTRARWLGLLFLAFSGATLLSLLFHKFDAVLYAPSSGGAELSERGIFPNYYVLFGANILQLFWAPQHLLGGWLTIALLLAHGSTGENRKRDGVIWDGGWGSSAVLGWAMSIFFSPLTAIGCVPFLLMLGVRKMVALRGESEVRTPSAPRSSAWGVGAATAVTSVLCLVVVGIYLSVRVPPPTGGAPQRGEHLEFLLAPLWRAEGWHALWRYGTFVLVEFGLMYALVWPRRNDNDLAAWRPFLGVGLLVLLLLPCFIYGYYNDLTMRVSIPSLAILFFSLALFFQSARISRARRVGALVLVLCGTTIFLSYSRMTARGLRSGAWNSRRAPSAFPTILDQYRDNPRHLLGQYTAPTDSPFARFFAK